MDISDLLKVLDLAPLWKRLKAVPDEIESLKRRIAELESKLSVRPGQECKFCGHLAMRLLESRGHPTLGAAGLKQEVWRCQNCGKNETKTARDI